MPIPHVRCVIPDTSSTSGAVKKLQKALRTILEQDALTGIQCQAGVAGNTSVDFTKVGQSIGHELGLLLNLESTFKKDGAPLSRVPIEHHVVPETTPTTAPVNHVGATLSTSNISVNVQQVIDPATSDNQFETPNAGYRFAAIKATITDSGTSNIQDDANNDFSVIGSDGQIYSAAFDTILGCTNFNNGEYGLTPGASVVGCVNFQIPTGVVVAKVDFSGSASQAEWVNP